jgi:uncharacterized protein (DUF2236 family)
MGYLVPVSQRQSVLRRVNREPVLLAGGGRALLMQIAHPKVAAGVAEHSRFREDRLGRLVRTLRPMYAIVFGTPEQARAAAVAVATRHATVIGPGYRANEPELLLWVHATLVDTALTMYTRFVGALSPETIERYYSEATRMGCLLGVPERMMPAGPAEFRRYMGEMVTSLQVSDEARAIAKAIFAPRPAPLAPVFLGARVVTAGLLPPPFRKQYELSWGPSREAALDAVARVSRATLPMLPSGLRRPPGFLMPARGATSGRRTRNTDQRGH